MNCSYHSQLSLLTTHGMEVDLGSSLNWVRIPDMYILPGSSVSNELFVLRFRLTTSQVKPDFYIMRDKASDIKGVRSRTPAHSLH